MDRKGRQKLLNWSKRAGQGVDILEATPSAWVTVNFAEETHPEPERRFFLLRCFTPKSYFDTIFHSRSAAAVYSLSPSPSSGKAHPESITFSPSSLICHYPRLFYNYRIISCTPWGGAVSAPYHLQSISRAMMFSPKSLQGTLQTSLKLGKKKWTFSTLHPTIPPSWLHAVPVCWAPVLLSQQHIMASVAHNE